MQPAWHLEVLGGMRASLGDLVVKRFRSRKAASLLAYLAIHLHADHSREGLTALFWPEADELSGRRCLRQELHSLRTQFDISGMNHGQAFLSDRQSLRLNRAVWGTDVEEFERCAATPSAVTEREQIASLERAMELYRGELLPGFYDEWIEPERRRLNDSYYSVLNRLVALLEKSGDFHRAIRAAIRMVGLEPLQEEPHLKLISLYALSGRAKSALKQYAELEKVLSEELGEEPSGAAKAFVEEIRCGKFDGRPIKQTLEATLDVASTGASGKRSISLPVHLTQFYGRQEEIDRISKLILSSSHRLITLTGMGGCGKTRLAIEIAKSVADRTACAIWFVPLADTWDASQLPGAILRATGAKASGTELKAISRTLEQEPSPLLILDNFEHLAESGTGFVRDLLEEVPHLRILVTSRFKLNLEGERVYQVEPLAVPRSAPTLELFMEYASAQLFVDHARAAQMGFELTKHNFATVRALCERLEGIPLAIELAAAWLSTMSPGRLLEGLEHRLDLLVSRRKDISPRHKSLVAAIEYGYLLLPSNLQRFFAQLGVFQGSWGLEAAAFVCEEPKAIHNLAELCERSFVRLRVDSVTEADRYEMLEALKEFAFSRLTDEEVAARRRRHAEYFADFGSQPNAVAWKEEPSSDLSVLSADHSNFLSALNWCIEAGEPALAFRIAERFMPYWMFAGPLSEGIAWTTRVLRQFEGAPPEVVAGALMAVGRLAIRRGDYELSRERSAQALAIYRGLGNLEATSRCLSTLGLLALYLGDLDQAELLQEESLQIARQANSSLGIFRALYNSGVNLLERGKYDLVSQRFEEALQLARELGQTHGEIMEITVLNGLGNLATYQRRHDAAARRYEQALKLSTQSSNKDGIASSSINLGGAAAALGRSDQGLRLISEGVRLAAELERIVHVNCGISSLSAIAVTLRDYETAAVLRGVLEPTKEAGATETCATREEASAVESALRSSLSPEAIEELSVRGQRMDIKHAVEFALCWAASQIEQNTGALPS